MSSGNTPNYVSFATHEADMARMERANQRLLIFAIVLLVITIITNSAWIWYNAQFEDVVTTTNIEAEQSAESDGRNIIVGGDYNGEADG